jgi:hypothetical protein
MRALLPRGVQTQTTTFLPMRSSIGRCFDEPVRDDPFEVDIRNVRRVELEPAADGGEIGDELFVESSHARPAGQLSAGDVGEPIACCHNGALRIASMGVDIDAGKIGYEPLIAERVDVENQRPLQLLDLASVSLGTEEQPQLQRHIEAGQPEDLIQLGPGKVVNAVPAVLDQAIELIHPHLAAVIELAGRARTKLAGVNAEDERPEQGGVGLIERTVDEDVVCRNGGAGQAQCFLSSARLTAILASRIDSLPGFEAGLRIRPPVTALRPSTLLAPFPPLRLDDSEDLVAMAPM